MAKKKPIKLNDQQLMLMASNVSDLYHQLSNDLFDNVVDRLKERALITWVNTLICGNWKR